MGGSIAGGKKAALTNKARYGDNFYQVMGSRGGKASKNGGFAYFKRIGKEDFIREAGRKGGAKSRRSKETYEKDYINRVRRAEDRQERQGLLAHIRNLGRRV